MFDLIFSVVFISLYFILFLFYCFIVRFILLYFHFTFSLFYFSHISFNFFLFCFYFCVIFTLFHLDFWQILSKLMCRRRSRGGEMGEFSPPFFWAPFFLFFLSLKYWLQTPQPGFGSITLLQKFTPHFKILDPRLMWFSYENAGPPYHSNSITC